MSSFASVTDKELIKNIKSISKGLPFEKLFFLKMSDIVNIRKLIKTENIMYMGKPLRDDKKQNIEIILRDSEAVRNLIVRDNKEYAKKLDNFFGKQKSLSGSRRNSMSNSNSVKASQRLTRKELYNKMQNGGTFGQYRIDFDNTSMGIANEVVEEFVRSYNYTDFLLTNRSLILDINLASYMLYGDVLLKTNDHNKASRIVFLFRASLAFRIAFVNILVVGFVYLAYTNRARVNPMDLLEPVKSLIFYGLTFDPRNLVQTEQTSGLGIVFTTIYRIISSVIPVKVVVFSMVGLFTIFGDSIRTGLQPDEATQDGIQVAQPVPNSILVSFILNGARAGVIFRRRLMDSPQALMDLVSLVNGNRRVSRVSERPNSAPQMNFTESRLIPTSTGDVYSHGPLATPRESATNMDAVRALGISARPHTAPQAYRFEQQQQLEERRRAQERERQRLDSISFGNTGTPEENLRDFYSNAPRWWLDQDEALRFEYGRSRLGQKGYNKTGRHKRKGRKNTTGKKNTRGKRRRRR